MVAFCLTDIRRLSPANASISNITKQIQKKTIENAQTMARDFMKKGYRVVSGGTDTHQVLIDLISKGISGKSAKNCLEATGIVLNRNVVPEDENTPGIVSGIRLGSGAVSARGMAAPQMQRIVEFMNAAMINQNNNEILKETSDKTLELCKAFPVNRSA